MLRIEDAFAKHKAAGIKNSHPGKIGRRSPITPIIRKTNPNKRYNSLAVLLLTGFNFIIILLKVQSYSIKFTEEMKRNNYTCLLLLEKILLRKFLITTKLQYAKNGATKTSIE